MAKRAKLTQLGRAVTLPKAPDEAVLEAVPNPHTDSDYVVRFTAPEFTSALPGHGPAGLRAFRHRLLPREIDRRIEIAETVSRRASAIMPRSTKTARSPSASAIVRGDQSRNFCASQATGIPAAACRSMCSGRQDDCRAACGCRIRASRTIADAADVDGNRVSP